MKKNQIIDLEITDLSYEAMGVAHYNGMTVFVTNALPGEVVSAKILKVKKKVQIGSKLNLISGYRLVWHLWLILSMKNSLFSSVIKWLIYLKKRTWIILRWVKL